MAAGVKRRAQPDGLAAELQLQPCGFGGCLPPGEKPQAQFYRRAAGPGQCQQQQRRNTQVDRQICRIRHAGAGAQDDEKDRPRQRNVQRRVPAGRRHQPPPAPPAERCRRDAQRRGGLVRDLHGVRLLGREQNQCRERRQCAARQHPGKRRTLAAQRPRRQQQKVRRQEIRQQQHIEIHHRFDTPTSPFCRHATTICAGWGENPRTVGCAKS